MKSSVITLWFTRLHNCGKSLFNIIGGHHLTAEFGTKNIHFPPEASGWNPESGLLMMDLEPLTGRPSNRATGRPESSMTPPQKKTNHLEYVGKC